MVDEVQVFRVGDRTFESRDEAEAYEIAADIFEALRAMSENHQAFQSSQYTSHRADGSQSSWVEDKPQIICNALYSAAKKNPERMRLARDALTRRN